MTKLKSYSFLLFIVSIVLLVSAPFWLWQLKKEQKLDVLVIDKTVPDTTYREHKGLMWLLNQQKYVQSNGKRYDLKKDYIGFVPKKDQTFDVKNIPSSTEKYDAVYIADTYGVYEEEFHNKNVSGKRSTKLYGGLTEQDMDALKDMAMKDGKTLIAEFNSMAQPTEEETRRKFYSLFNLEWSGWIGRYFPELENSEVPQWVRDNYEKQYDKTYHFKGPGYVLVDENDRLVVLDKEDIGEKGVVFSTTPRGEELIGEEINTPYSYWFDIVEAINPDEVVANYTLSLSKSGKDMLKALDLPVTFPAVVHGQNRQYDTYYFSGDYADQADVPDLYQTVGFPSWRKWTGSSKPDDSSQFYWKAYNPMMKAILEDIQKGGDDKKKETVEATKENGVQLAGKTGRDYIQVKKDGKWEDLLIKGVNMGIARPGSFPGETAISKEEYMRWFKQIGAMNANALRIYTIHPPAFYEAFYEYNQMADKPLYLFHGVWVNEEIFLKSEDAFAKENTDEFASEIKKTIDLVHGNAEIPERKGHASGSYTYDISPYVLGWVFGVEWDPEVVLATNEKHKGLQDFKGEYIKTDKAQPFEIWLTERMDEGIKYETETYQWQRPVSFTNWVTTDLLDHPSEPLEKEDMVSVDPNVMKGTDKLKTGLFASYHIYPYYPDFLNYEQRYIDYIDHRGEKNNYAGYLHDMKKAHSMPLVVAEFGVPGSRGLTHKNIYGMDQGHHSEQEQGAIDRKLFEDIVEEKMAGGMVFAWQDEWFKRTWNTMDYDNPDRRPFWQNAQTNEQQFGMVSFDPGESRTSMIHVDGRPLDWTFNGIEPAFDEDGHSMYVTSDERFVYVRIDSNRISEGKDTYLLFDTIENQGQSTIPDVKGVSTKGVDFALHIKGTKEARLWIDSYYDTHHYQYGHVLNMIEEETNANVKNNGTYHPIRLTLNKSLDVEGEKIPFQSYETGILKFGTSNPQDEAYDSLTDISVNSGRYEIRIPWQLLNIKDPSLKEAVGDIWSGNGLQSSITLESIKIGLYETDGENVFSYPSQGENGFINPAQFYPYSWDTWDLPASHERLKQSYYEMKEAFEKEGE
ncbi:hypothetical protein LCD52_17900 [Rossellomorea vietnamensis]|uniref:hypothetical protein n=1 Tax=Rossellomorea vietnamensis TaxID=218284 RepID=UPI001CCA2730|nr:hypothetical protein [Rossellomorea vietnamensis]MCA0150636.1 hypothetical protein [Rossellomorea vietnamensis]